METVTLILVKSNQTPAVGLCNKNTPTLESSSSVQVLFDVTFQPYGLNHFTSDVHTFTVKHDVKCFCRPSASLSVPPVSLNLFPPSLLPSLPAFLHLLPLWLPLSCPVSQGAGLAPLCYVDNAHRDSQAWQPF